MPAAEPFRVAVPDAVLDRILARVRDFPWEGLADAGGWSCGTDLGTLRDLCARWTGGYDWRAEEARLNRLPQCRVAVEGEALHAVHLPGVGPAPMPLLLTHGWPGSFDEFAEVVGPLADPGRFGGDPADAFHVVAPSLPGYAFSDRPARPLGPRAIAGRLRGLMEALGHPRFLAQGGDWGAHVSGWLGHDHPEACLGLHLNMVLLQAADAGPASPDAEAHAAARRETQEREGGYAHQQATRPQTLGLAMVDNPVGVAAWILEKFAAWSDLPRGPDGAPDLWARHDRDRMLTGIMLYLVTGAFPTSTWIYRGRADEGSGQLPAGGRVRVPTGIAAFPDPVFAPPPREQAALSYDVVRWTAMPRGGHFAALEAPDLFVAELRAFARMLR